MKRKGDTLENNIRRKKRIKYEIEDDKMLNQIIYAYVKPILQKKIYKVSSKTIVSITLHKAKPIEKKGYQIYLYVQFNEKCFDFRMILYSTIKVNRYNYRYSIPPLWLLSLITIQDSYSFKPVAHEDPSTGITDAETAEFLEK